MYDYDAIVVGARCAGSPTAMLLARHGHRVLLVDRVTFPSDSFRNHAILYRGMRYLHQWGILDRIAASNCPPFRQLSVDLGDGPLIGRPPAEEGIPGEYAPRRIILDKILVDAAVEAGAELQEGCTVEGLLRDGDRVTGIRARTAKGSKVEATAPIVVGADGLHSFVARSVKAPTYNERPVITCSYYSYWSGVSIEGIEVYIRDHPTLILAFPTNNGQVCVAVQWPAAQFHTIRGDIEGSFFQAIELAPELAERVRGGKREDRFLGTADLPNFFRKAWGPGWALVGDAGIHKDPFTASGISDSFRDAQLLADAIHAGLSGPLPLDEALAEYERERDEARHAILRGSLPGRLFPAAPCRGVPSARGPAW